MITMNVDATVSKRGTDVSSSVGTLPATSEHIIKTTLRTRASEPAVIGGLIRQEKGMQVSELPLLGDIPYLGVIFQSRKETLDSSELVIYIVPHIDYAIGPEQRVSAQLARLYEKFAEF